MTIVFRLANRETGKALGQKQAADQVAREGRADQREQQKGGDIPNVEGLSGTNPNDQYGHRKGSA